MPRPGAAAIGRIRFTYPGVLSPQRGLPSDLGAEAVEGAQDRRPRLGRRPPRRAGASGSRPKSPQVRAATITSTSSSELRHSRSRSSSSGTKWVSAGIASCGWESSISRSRVVPERPTPTTNGAGGNSAARRPASGVTLRRASGAATIDSNSRSPSADPVRGSTACSGWGISPTTLPRSLQTPATSATEPLGFWPARVAEDDLIARLEPVERVAGREPAPAHVLDRDREPLARRGRSRSRPCAR